MAKGGLARCLLLGIYIPPHCLTLLFVPRHLLLWLYLKFHQNHPCSFTSSIP